jgi:hypothetical protein
MDATPVHTHAARPVVIREQLVAISEMDKTIVAWEPAVRLHLNVSVVQRAPDVVKELLTATSA